jgi:hypothetical protein
MLGVGKTTIERYLKGDIRQIKQVGGLPAPWPHHY